MSRICRCDTTHNHLVVFFMHVSFSFIFQGVPQGEGEATASRCSKQRSDASHYHPAALVPCLSDKVALSTKERCIYDHTGAVHILKYRTIGDS